MIKIIGGKFKKTNLEVPEDYVRPTSALKREAIFSILESDAIKNSYELYKNKCFIDLFAGSGAFGLEAISRGATYCVFYEINNKVYDNLQKNCKLICQENEYKIYLQNSNFINNLELNYPLSSIFIDPPYDYNNFESLLNKLLSNKILNRNSIIIIETKKNKKIEFPKNLRMIKSKIYGKTKIIFLKKL